MSRTGAVLGAGRQSEQPDRSCYARNSKGSALWQIFATSGTPLVGGALGGGRRGMEDRGSTTANHYDRVHATTF